MSAAIHHGQSTRRYNPSHQNRAHPTTVEEGPPKEQQSAFSSYVKGTTEEIKKVTNSYGIKSHIKPTRKLMEILCKPKDRLEPKEVCGPFYKIVCGGGGGEKCNETHIGETE